MATTKTTKAVAKKPTVEAKLKARVKELDTIIETVSYRADRFETRARQAENKLLEIEETEKRKVYRIQEEESAKVKLLKEQISTLTEMVRWWSNPETAMRDLELKHGHLGYTQAASTDIFRG